MLEPRPAKVGKWTEPALRVLRERYLLRKDGEVIETPEEMCWRVAVSIAAGGGGFRPGPTPGWGGGRGLLRKMGRGALIPEFPAPQKSGQGKRTASPARY